MELTRGANATVVSSAVSLVLEWNSGHGVDPHALLLTETGKIRSNDDFVFFNAPRHPSGTVILEPEVNGQVTMRLTLTAIDPAVSRVVISGSVDDGTFQDVSGLAVRVHDGIGTTLHYTVDQCEPVTAIVLGEFYRRNSEWKFRAVGQGWDTGLRGLAEEFGVEVDDPVDPVPPQQVRGARPTAAMPAGWYPVPATSSNLRWWNGTVWTDDHRQAHPAHDPAICARCGRPRRVPRFGGQPAPCRWCETEVNGLLETWRAHAWQVLTTTGPHGPSWDELWLRLRFDVIDETTGRAALPPLAIAHLERVVAFAFADGEIEQHELDDFDRTVADLDAATDLRVAAQHIKGLRARMLRGRSLTQVKVGELPSLQRSDLHLEAGELLYLDVNATQIRLLASGPKSTPGRLLASSKKLRFIGAGAGSELTWAKIVSIRHEYNTVIISATTARGGGSYRVPDAEYVAAVLEGALRVAKRLVLPPGERDSRSIPADVKSLVWQRDNGRCVECSATQYLEFDHIIPWSRGGATSFDNLQILCRGCNQAKGARL